MNIGDKTVKNFQIEVHTVNRVYVSKLCTEKNYVKYKEEPFDKVFLIVYDKSIKVKSLPEEFPIFINQKEIFINPAQIEFIQIYKNLSDNEVMDEGVYYLQDFPYKKNYQKKKSLF